jgi:hypothetical protein
VEFSAVSCAETGPETEELSGWVEEIDLPAGELKVRVGGQARTLDVAPGCLVFLHGERVKLRLLQPNDHVRMVCTRAGEDCVAHSICVQWWPPLP